MRLICLAFAVLLTGCPDLDTICPYKPITQGVFGEVADGSGTLEQNVEVDIYTILNGVQDMKVAGIQTSRGGYQFNMNPGVYMLCAKAVCTIITVPLSNRSVKPETSMLPMKLLLVKICAEPAPN